MVCRCHGQAAAGRKLRQLKGNGVRISIDDLGAGYSSLSYLRSFPFEEIKIDQSFVRGSANVRTRWRSYAP
jgi:EAL domain-containing protein (putative c-di-GMP-specific phosphodiesterase class I)